MDTVDNAIIKPARRVEVFTGSGRRRAWSDEDKARIVAEIVTSGASVSAVARRHGLSPQQLFGWRRQLRTSPVGLSDAQERQFVPAVLDMATSSPSVRRQRKMARCQVEPGAGMIEVEIDGIIVRIGRDAAAGTIAAVLRALKATA
jgi:transposase